MSTSVRFAVAVHVLALLATHPDELLTSSHIAGSVNTNPVVVRRLLRLLQRAKLVQVQAGAAGGARLARPARSIDLRTVHAAVEEREAFAVHGGPNPACPIGRCITGVLESISTEATEAMLSSLSRRTLSDVVGELEKPGPRAPRKR